MKSSPNAISAVGWYWGSDTCAGGVVTCRVTLPAWKVESSTPSTRRPSATRYSIDASRRRISGVAPSARNVGPLQEANLLETPCDRQVSSAASRPSARE